MATAGARRARGRNQRSELAARIWVALPAVAFALAIVILGGWWFVAGLALLGLVCLHELFDLYDEVAPARLAGFAGLVGVLVAAYAGEHFHVLLAFVAFFPVLFFVQVLQVRASGLGMGITALGVAWVGLALAHGVLLRELPHGQGIIIDVLVGTYVGDSGAYLGGRLFGRRLLVPRISPNKTWEGLGIGMVTAVVFVWLAGLYQDWLSGTDALLLGLAVALAAPLGDLFESFFKRDAGTKDTGRLFGVHGGALDRLDATLFSAVVGYYVWRALL